MCDTGRTLSSETTNNSTSISDIFKLTKELKKKQKENKIKYLNDTNTQLHAAVQNDNGRIPHRMVPNIADESKEVCPWITRDVINRSFKNFKAEQQLK